MKQIEVFLEKWKDKKPAPEELDKRLSVLLSHPDIQHFKEENPNLSWDDYKRSITVLQEFVREAENCRYCPGLGRCANLLKGYQSKLTLNTHGKIDIVMNPCHLLIQKEENAKGEELHTRRFFISQELQNASLKKIWRSQSRRSAIHGINNFLEGYESNTGKGLYLWGPSGVGKSWLVTAMANELESRGVKVVMINLPVFMAAHLNAEEKAVDPREVYARCVEAPVLVLDNIGTLPLPASYRDEWLGSILNRRVNEQRPTVYTSRYDLDNLVRKLAYSKEEHKLRAQRILQRIGFFTEEIYFGH
mgnify:CR=1 FL=1